MTVARVVVVIVGLVVLAVDATAVVRTLIVTRPPGRPLSLPIRTVRRAFYGAARHTRTYGARDRVLAVMEPIALVVQLAVWLTVAMLGFALLFWGFWGGSFDAAFGEAGSSLYTLGIASAHQTPGHVIDFLAAGTGMVLVGLQIAYLPTLYNSYNRRETLVTLLESRAGAPAWGPELLMRHQLIAGVENLPSLFAEWERWAADVAESHTSYPSLLHLRSPRTKNSWIVSLLAVMDAAAFYLAVDAHGAPIEARMCVRMGFTCLRDIAAVRRIPFEPDPDPDDPIVLPEEEFVSAYDRLATLGFPMSRSADEAWPHFRGWRVNYESVIYGLAKDLDAPPARWAGPRLGALAESLVPIRPVDRQPSAPPDPVTPGSR
jgi:hypothetical protein